MAKKALFVGINTYPSPADSLEAPSREARKWERLFRGRYKFDDVQVLPEASATRKGILKALRELLGNASSDDLLFFGFGGHGAEVNGWESDDKTNQRKEHGLIGYASPQGALTFQNASITPSDIARILEETKPPANATVVIGLDACFAAAFGEDGDADILPTDVNPKALFIRDAVRGLPDGEAVTFAAIAALVSDPSIASPMIVAAAEADQTAVEVGPPHDRRLLFSRQAIRRLQRSFAEGQPISTRCLVDEINPLRPLLQNATIVGNALPQDDPFGGGFPQPQPGSSAVPISALSAGSSVTTDWSLEMRIIGLATFITQPPEEPYRTRIVLPFDNYEPPESKDHHSGFIEVAEQDMPELWIGTVPYRYIRAGIRYARWAIDGHVVRFANVPASGEPVQPSWEFTEYVPGLTTTAPELEPYPEPRDECFDEVPLPGLINGFIDLQAGSVTIGELEDKPTEFRGQHSGATTRPAKKTAVCARVTIPLDKNHAVITLENEAGNRTVIFVRSGATIVAGNAREADITGPGSGEGDPQHFLVYYELSPKQPVYDPGLPQKELVPINACTVTTYP